MNSSRFLTTLLTLATLLGVSSCSSSGKRKNSRLDSGDYSYRERGTDEVGSLSDSEVNRIRNTTQGWIWPVKNAKLTSRYGHRSGDYHDGVDLKASRKTPVYSAASGTVLYASDKISGYGKMIVIRHEDQLSTVYAHNDRMMVKKGARVDRGQLIALSGNTGRSSGPHVHFEVRKGTKAIDPVAVMPPPGARPQDEKTSRIATRSRTRSRATRNIAQVSEERREEPRPSRRTRRITRSDHAESSQSGATRRRIVRR